MALAARGYKPSDDQGLDAVGQFLVLFGGHIQVAQIQDQLLPGAFIGADLFDQMEVLIYLPGVAIGFADLFNINGVVLILTNFG